MRRTAAGAVIATLLTVSGCVGSSAPEQQRPPPTSPGDGSGAPVALPSPVSHAGRRPCASSADPVTLPTQALLAVQFVDSATGWVVTGRGLIGTTDGGAHWRRRLGRRVRSSGQIDFVDRGHGWVLVDGDLRSTVDGGRRWTRLPAQCPAISRVHFFSARAGYAVTGGRLPSGRWRSGPLLRTHDGGRSWTRVASPGQPQDVCTGDGTHAWLAAGGRIYRTVDGARSWTLVEPGARHPAGFIPSATVQCSGSRDAWALISGGAGSSQEAHTAFHLHDQGSFPLYTEGYFPHPGVHTTVESPGSYHGPFTAISRTTAVFVDYCPACGSGTAPIAATHDGGHSIRRLGDIPGLSEATGASFVTADEGWIIGVKQLWRRHRHRGMRYRILHTDDGAAHWTVQRQTTRYDQQ